MITAWTHHPADADPELRSSVGFSPPRTSALTRLPHHPRESRRDVTEARSGRAPRPPVHKQTFPSRRPGLHAVRNGQQSTSCNGHNPAERFTPPARNLMGPGRTNRPDTNLQRPGATGWSHQSSSCGPQPECPSPWRDPRAGSPKKGRHTRPGRFYIYSGAQSFSASNSFLVLADHGFLLLHLR
jgi:hypothetical protein